MSEINDDGRRLSVEEQARHWVVREASGNFDEMERRQRNVWLAASPLNEDAYRRERCFWNELASLESRFLPYSATPKRGLYWGPMLATAACLVMVLAFGLIPEGDFYTTSGEIRTVDLPDGSRVLLDADSAFDISYSAERRRIDLRRGRAWFQVAHNAQRPFEVGVDHGVVRAVGTAFQVRALREGASVSVTEGVVSVRPTEKKRWEQVYVRAGEKLSYQKDGLLGPIVEIDSGNAIGWSRGRLDLEGRPLVAALSEIERYQPGRILLLDRSVAERSVSAMLALDRIEQGLDALAESENLRVLRVTSYLTVLY